MLVGAMDANGDGLSLVFENGVIALVASDRERRASWSCDAGLLQPEHGPGIVTWIVDGVLCDGGDERVRGWQRFRGPGETETALGRAARVASGRAVERDAGVRQLRVYRRALRTSEAVGNFRWGG